MKVNILEQILGSEWSIIPAGGSTGDAFLAESDGQKLFLKRNSSPFLAVLSAEGIVPKLVWTKRVENGDVFSAQHWKTGRHLSPNEMQEARVARMLKKIHNSKELLQMLKRMRVEPLLPFEIHTTLIKNLDKSLLNDEIIQKAFAYLQDALELVQPETLMVCHSDVNHNNWLLSSEGDLYLIDWDEAVIADPAIDLGIILYCYIPKDDWGKWLANYGVPLTYSLETRVKWYTIVQSLLSIQYYGEKLLEKQVAYWREILEMCLEGKD